jgi:hypothetical protein
MRFLKLVQMYSQRCQLLQLHWNSWRSEHYSFDSLRLERRYRWQAHQDLVHLPHSLETNQSMILLLTIKRVRERAKDKNRHLRLERTNFSRLRRIVRVWEVVGRAENDLTRL